MRGPVFRDFSGEKGARIWKRHPDGLLMDGPALCSVELPPGWRLEGLD